jgi:Subtilase family
MPWEYDRRPGAGQDGVLDPYFLWALGPGREDFLLPGDEPQRIALLVRRRGRLRQRIALLVRGRRRLRRRERERFETLFLTPGEIRERIFQKRFRQQFERFTLGPPLREASLAPRNAARALAARPASTSGPLGPRTVVVGIIDDGLPFGHERFFRADGTTRIESVWVQDGDYDGGRSGFDYGRLITKAEIDAWLAAAALGDWDEDEFYRRAGVADFARRGRKPVARHASHGAHVMDLACGFEPGRAPDWRIVGVQLPTATTADSSGASLAPYVIDAVKHIRDVARSMAGSGATPPVVINFSYGLTAGPHDGTHEIEAAIDEIVRDHNATAGNRPMRVVIPSGNSHLARLHARISFDAVGEVVELPWRVQPDDLTPSFVEIWLPPGPAGAQRVALRVATPAGAVSVPLREWDGGVLRYRVDNTVLCKVRYRFVTAPTGRGMFLVALKPTVRPLHRPQDRPAAPSGVWSLQLRNLALAPGEMVDAWVQRDDAPIGYPVRGRQSYFDHECYRRHDHAGWPLEEDDLTCIVRRYGSINAIATGDEPVVVGGMYRKELRLVRYSAGGSTIVRAGAMAAYRDGPDVLAPSDDSVGHPGQIGAGTRSGSAVVMNGTSVAAPLITRRIARDLANGLAGDRGAVRAAAASWETVLPPPTPPPERAGAGRIPVGPVRIDRGVERG